MKTIIVYYSLEGNTEYAANLIASALNAERKDREPESRSFVFYSSS